ncbi:hypothetical protein QAD02_015820 [Eretmocerus hayati]|uniref:Uncharacterized protein n=1 Tax=Eretmocerus hayati TaxID=131215 RepID=A0ACC2P9D0_9HYME|nr:hypothetical protein QAD02_015820 [Eretmocerus hayati]
MDPLQIFENFKLDTLDEYWSNEVWTREFLSFPDPPVEYSILLGSEDMEASLKETVRTVKEWINQNKQDDEEENGRVEVSWQTLVALNINIRGLLAVLGYLMKTGQAAGADEDSRQACLASASLYFTLLSIPGSSTFQVFHPNLYQWAIETLKMCEHLVEVKKARYTDYEALYGDDRGDGLLQSEKKTLVCGLNSILFELIKMLETFYMKYQVRSLEMTVTSLVDLTKLETDINHFRSKSHRPCVASKTTLSYNAYVALKELCDPRHGAKEDTIRLILKYLMPHLCANHLDMTPKAVNIVWDTTIDFVKNLLDSSELSGDLGFEILVQQLLFKCPDRSEPRQKQAGVVAKLINSSTAGVFIKSIGDLIKFAFNEKIPYRIFAQEVIAKLLTEMCGDTCDDTDEDRERVKKILIATALCRSVDCSSMVRGKAMSLIESIVNNGKMTARDFLDMSNENKPFPGVKQLLDALESDLDPLPGPKTFSTLLLARIEDERALVRRSAIHALESLVTHFPPLLGEIVPVIGRHCRDPALTVRKDAVHSLANLLQKHPSNEELLEEYVKSALPRAYDVENKVQEKVLETVQLMVLDQMKAFSETNNEEECLAWKIIRRITNGKMRKNLSKICESWVKNQIITKPLMIKIQSHIDTDHDLEAWILLLALAENTELRNLEEYYENYEKIFESNDFVSSIKIEVLRHSWRSLGKDLLKKMYKHIFECLCSFQVCLESISVCVDILGFMTKHLHKSRSEDLMNSHVIELIRLSEAQIEQLTEESEPISDEVINIYLKAMNTLGHASFLCSESVSESTLNIVQGILLDCQTLETSVECIERLKAAGIVLVGQQAMRDRDFAQQIMPILGQFMRRQSTSESPAQAAIRINAVKALADLCIRFTALVEPYLSDMCICMKDPNSMTKNKFHDRRVKKKEKDALTLPGQKNQKQRRIIYDFMLEHLDPPNKLKILTKLNFEVFEGISEKFINVKQVEGAGVLRDVLYIISNDRMQASFGTKMQDDESQDDTTVEHPMTNAINVIVEGMKKFKFTVMLPTLIKLKQFLSSAKSPLLVDVSKFFIKFLSEFNKDQLAEIYDEHPNLKKEIDRDIELYGRRPDASSSDSEEEIVPAEATGTQENTNVLVRDKDAVNNSETPVTEVTRTPKKRKLSATPRKIHDIHLVNGPRIVLRRLSTLTYPGVTEWKSPPRETRCSINSDPEPSTSSGISVSSQSPTDDIGTLSPDFSEPEISSTPKPKKIARLCREIDVQSS